MTAFTSRLRRGTILVAAASALLIGVAACSSAAPAATPKTPDAKAPAQLQTLNLVTTKYDAELLPVTVGQQLGFFKQHGVDLQVTKANTSDIAAAALVSGRVDLGIVQGAYVTSAAAAGAKIQMIGALMDQLDYHIITAKDITSLKQLQGKTMGDPGPSNGNTATMKAVMDKAGYKSTSLTYATVGAQNAILAGLQANQVQVGLLVAPYTIQARAAGLHDLGTVTKYVPDMSAAAFAGVPENMKKKSAVIKNFMAALVEGSQWASKNKAKAIAILEKASGMTPTIAKQSYAEAAPYYTKTGHLSVSGLKGWIADAVKYGVQPKSVPVSAVYTDSYLAKG
jgi:ABC-type nitrate/sulfonate/bicarbonate transport system substrate-binding protein